MAVAPSRRRAVASDMSSRPRWTPSAPVPVSQFHVVVDDQQGLVSLGEPSELIGFGQPALPIIAFVPVLDDPGATLQGGLYLCRQLLLNSQRGVGDGIEPVQSSVAGHVAGRRIANSRFGRVWQRPL